jgi:hypothetical protein
MENQQLTAQTAKGLSAGIAVKTGTVGANWHQIDTKLSTTLGLMGGLTRGGSARTIHPAVVRPPTGGKFVLKQLRVMG